MNDFKQNIIEKIKKGEVDMKPKWHFVLKTIFMVSGLILSALVTIYLLSFIFFALHRSGVLFAPGYGIKGVIILLSSSPWILITLAVIFLISLYLLVKHYAFCYKRPLLYSMLGVLFVVVLGSVGIEQIKMHDRIQSFTEKHNIPAAAPFYRGAIEGISEHITYGTVESVDGNEISIINGNGDILYVATNETTRQKPGSTYQVGERLLIYGKKGDQDRIQAFGIKKVDENFRKRLRQHNQEGQMIRPFMKHGPI